MIEAKDLTKRFGGRAAVDGVTFSIGKGEVVGFLGPNGAGKSTTMRMLTGYLPPSSGEARVGGLDVTAAPLATRAAIGYLPENNPLYEDLRVCEYLSFRAALKGVPRGRRAGRIDTVVGLAELGEVRGRIIGACSKGFRQRIGLADALLSDPPVLILDEPTVGLDPAQVVHVRELIKTLAQDHTVVLSTHILPEVEAICSRAMILHRGHLLYDGPVADLRRGLQGPALLVTASGDAEAVRTCLASVPGVVSVEPLAVPADGRPRFRVRSGDGSDVREDLFWTCARANVALVEMVTESVSLEEAFLSLTTRDAADGAAEEVPA